jgi:hypothetical protein
MVARTNVAKQSPMTRASGSFLICASGWMQATGTQSGGGSRKLMTENERRAQDVLTREDVIRRIALAGGMIATFLSALLIVSP